MPLQRCVRARRPSSALLPPASRHLRTLVLLHRLPPCRGLWDTRDGHRPPTAASARLGALSLRDSRGPLVGWINEGGHVQIMSLRCRFHSISSPAPRPSASCVPARQQLDELGLGISFYLPILPAHITIPNPRQRLIIHSIQQDAPSLRSGRS
ncbi:hypothetical protein FB451DRAFT_1285687 [Mycena latifolia]|nr:hypothetical protein FB451DRAFT_1285687 [Mycena latifolia]